MRNYRYQIYISDGTTVELPNDAGVDLVWETHSTHYSAGRAVFEFKKIVDTTNYIELVDTHKHIILAQKEGMNAKIIFYNHPIEDSYRRLNDKEKKK